MAWFKSSKINIAVADLMSCIAKIRSIVPYLSFAVVDLWAVISSLSENPYSSVSWAVFVGYSMAPTSWTTDKPNYGAVDSRSIDMSIMHLVPLGRTVSVSVSLPQLINHHLVSYSGNVADTVMRGWSSMTVLFRRAMTAVCTQLQTKGETTCEKWSEFSIQGRQVGKQHISQVWIK